MRGSLLNSEQLRRALEALAALLPPATPATMTLIGGGGGVLAGLLPAQRHTVDIDVIDVDPPEVFDLCCHHAPRVADACGLSPGWLDATAHTMRHMMLAEWRERTIPVGEFGPLKVQAIGRIDLISLKLIAGRQRDLEDLAALRMTTDEARRLTRELPTLLRQGANPDVVEGAIRLLRQIGGSDGSA
jgi:hypothetical protein